MSTNPTTNTASSTNNYNSRMSSCPGYESTGLRGYVDLLSLQTDVLEYYSSFAQLFPTSSPSNSYMPSSDTVAPSLDPTVSLQPSIFTYTPTERVTRRPSPYPTSDIREPFKPTSSPAPTITMAVYNGGGNNNNNNDTTSILEEGEIIAVDDDDMGLNLLPEEPGTVGFNGTLPSDLNITNNNNNITTTTTTTTMNATTAPSMSSSQIINNNRLLQTNTTAASTEPTKISFLICPNTILSFEDDSSSNIPPIILETPARNNHAIEIACITAPLDTTSSSSGSGSGTGKSCVMSGGNVHMYMKYIPGYSDIHNDNNDDNDATVITTSSGQDGMTTNATVTADTATNTTATAAEVVVDTNNEENYHPITISGIVFRNAIQSSILMNDPRGKIYFRNCAWENNSGVATMLIHGRYDTTAGSQEEEEEEGGEGNEDVAVANFGEEVVEQILGGEEGGVTSSSNNNSSAADNNNNNMMSTTSSTVNFANFILTTTATSFITTTPMLDADATLSPFDIVNDDDEMMMLATSRPPKDDEDSRELFMMDQGDIILMASRQAEGENRKLGTRLLEADDAPLSMIFIENCVFSGNQGNSTIIVSSKFEELLATEQDLGSLDINGGRYLEVNSSSTPKFAHWIHVAISDTSFTTEAANGSIIDNYGGRLQLTRCAYVNNTAESMVESEFGTVVISSTEFDMNDVRGDVGVVVLDSESSLELNEGNCDAAAPSTSNRCGGIDYGGVCIAFDSCETLTNETMQEVGDGGPCFTDWDDLVAAVRDRPNNEIDFIICPGAALVATTSPVVINANSITIQCGTALSQSKNCFISGGYSHFHVEGSAAGVQLARLSMSASTGSNIMGLGTSDATLTVRDCEFIMNEGSTAIVINNGESMSSSASTDAAGAVTAAMSVEVVNCTFARNELSFGTIANNGGELSVINSRFMENSGTGGNIVVMKRGTCNIQGCCFGLSSSVSPGTIFVDEGSIIIGNENNFGSENSAGGLSDGSTCFDIFQEAKDSDCLNGGSSKCAGSCKAFTATSCRLDDTGEIENSADNEDISVPAFNKDGGSQSSKIVPIAVATVVCVIIVFGLIGIILRRRKSNVRRSQRRGTSRRDYGEVDDDDFPY